jgi:hypothetical protein
VRMEHLKVSPGMGEFLRVLGERKRKTLSGWLWAGDREQKTGLGWEWRGTERAQSGVGAS